MFGWGRKQEKEFQEKLKFRCYEPINLAGNLAVRLKSLDKAVVLLQSKRWGECFYRGELSYDEGDSEALYLKNIYDKTTRKSRVLLDEVTGLMKEI